MRRLRSRFRRSPRSAASGASASGAGAAPRHAMRHGLGARGRRSRLMILTACIIAGLSGLAARCVHLQVFRASALLELARSQHEKEITLDPQRGPILDRNGHELALSLDVDSLFADPSEVGDAGAAARRLAPVLGLKAADLRDRLDSDRHFVWLKRKIDPELRRRIESLDIHGLGFVRESRRFYPKQGLAAHLIGSCGLDNQGLAGLEFAYNDRFTGTPGRLVFQRDGRGGRVLDRSRLEPVPGDGLVLTVDEAIQHITERELDAAMQDTQADGAAIVVLRPATGEVLALASRPGFDPNDYARAEESARHNRAVSDSYEPGSTFKVITAAAALDAGKVRPDEVIWCENGKYVVAKHTYHEDRLPYGNLTFTEVLARSSNVGTIKVALRMRSSDFDDAIRRFGFGTQTALELPGESKGLLRDLEDWSGLSHASIAMGQEIGVTPIQLAAALGAVANDGVYNPPYLVEAILSADRQRIATERPTGDAGSRRAVSAQAARTLRQMLRSVTADGTGKAARVPGYTTGGKTGTAQKIEPGGRGYARGRHVAWFAGFVPAEKPELVIVVMVDEPKGPLFHGGDVAAPVFSRVAQPVLEYLGVPPDGEGALTVDPSLRASLGSPASGGRTGAGRMGGGPAGAPAAVPAKNTRTSRGGEVRGGEVRGGDPRHAARSTVQAGMLAGVMPSLTDGSTMPNLSGMSLRRASETLAALGLNCTSQRAGPRVARQQPEPGVPVRPGDRCAVVYE